MRHLLTHFHLFGGSEFNSRNVSLISCEFIDKWTASVWHNARPALEICGCAVLSVLVLKLSLIESDTRLLDMVDPHL